MALDFFDVKKGNSPICPEYRINISCMYYLGEYLSLEEVEEIHSIWPYTLKSKKWFVAIVDT